GEWRPLAMFHAASSSNHIAWAWIVTALTTTATTNAATSAPRCRSHESRGGSSRSAGGEAAGVAGRVEVAVTTELSTRHRAHLTAALGSVDAEQRGEEAPGEALGGLGHVLRRPLDHHPA